MDNKQQNNQNYKSQREERKNLSQKEKLVLKITSGVIAAIAAINAIYYVVMMFFLEKTNYYMHHFLPVCMTAAPKSPQCGCLSSCYLLSYLFCFYCILINTVQSNRMEFYTGNLR